MALKLATRVMQSMLSVISPPAKTGRPAPSDWQSQLQREQKLRRAGASQQDLDDLNGTSKWRRSLRLQRSS